MRVKQGNKKCFQYKPFTCSKNMTNYYFVKKKKQGKIPEFPFTYKKSTKKFIIQY